MTQSKASISTTVVVLLSRADLMQPDDLRRSVSNATEDIELVFQIADSGQHLLRMRMTRYAHSDQVNDVVDEFMQRIQNHTMLKHLMTRPGSTKILSLWVADQYDVAGISLRPQLWSTVCDMFDRIDIRLDRLD